MGDALKLLPLPVEKRVKLMLNALKQVYPRGAEHEAVVGVTTLVTSLAMNYVHRGSYFPETSSPAPPPSPAASAAPLTPEPITNLPAKSNGEQPSR